MVAAIEASFALLEKPVGFAWFDAIKSSEMSLGLIPKVFDAIDVIPSIR